MALWVNPPFEMLGAFTKKVEQAATTGPKTKALMILPLRTGDKDFCAFLERNYWDLIGCFAANSNLFSKPGRQGIYGLERPDYGSCTEDIGVFILKKRPDEK